MDYFLLDLDTRITNNLKLGSFTKSMAEADSDVLITENTEAKYSDYIRKIFLFDTYHIFSDKIKSAIDIYATLDSKTIFVTDLHKQIHVYWKVKIPIINNCYLEDYSCGKKEIVLNEELILSLPIFLIDIEKHSYVIVKFDLAESILRRLPLGIKFKSVSYRKV